MLASLVVEFVSCVTPNFPFSNAAGVRVVVCIQFCSQGDNIPDAIRLATYLNSWLQMVLHVYNCISVALYICHFTLFIGEHKDRQARCNVQLSSIPYSNVIYVRYLL